MPRGDILTTLQRSSPGTRGRVRWASTQAVDLSAALRKRIEGEVRFDPGSRALYATDLSIYRRSRRSVS